MLTKRQRANGICDTTHFGARDRTQEIEGAVTTPTSGRHRYNQIFGDIQFV